MSSSEAGSDGMRLSGWRRFLAWLLVILASLLSLLAPVAVWVRFVALDTGTFTDMVAPLISEDEVARAVSDEATRLLFENVDISRAVSEGLPQSLEFLEEGVTAGAEELVREVSREILRSESFQPLWREIISTAHSEAVQAIREEGEIQVTGEGEVVLDMSALLDSMLNGLADLGIESLRDLEVPEDAGQVLLFESEQLGDVKRLALLLDDWYWVPSLLALLLFGAAVLVADDRRKAVMIAGGGLAVAMSVSLVALSIARGQFTGTIDDIIIRRAATVVWERAVRGLVVTDLVLLPLGVLLVLGGVLAGPYGWAVSLRSRISKPFRRRPA